jgi:hypothetical protein
MLSDILCAGSHPHILQGILALLGAWGLVSTGLILRLIRRARGGPLKTWKDGFDSGCAATTERFQRLTEALHKRGPQHHIHDIEMEVRRIAGEVRARTSSAG